MVIITVNIFGREIERNYSKWHIFQFSWNEKKNTLQKQDLGDILNFRSSTLFVCSTLFVILLLFTFFSYIILVYNKERIL